MCEIGDKKQMADGSDCRINHPGLTRKSDGSPNVASFASEDYL